MKCRVIMQRTVTNGIDSWTETKTCVANLPLEAGKDSVGQPNYHVVGVEEMPLPISPERGENLK